MRRLVAGLLAVMVSGASIWAQPLPDPMPVDRNAPGPKIPVTMSGNTEVLGAEAVGSAATPAPLSLEQPIDPDAYICGPGDVFELNFWGRQNFRLRMTADLEGRTFISKVGFVTVTGLTLTAVRKDIKDKVRINYPGLMFELTLVVPRSFLVHVVDNVKQPGSFTTHALERVSSVLARAGNTNGSRRRIAIHRKNGKDITADLVMYELTGDTTYNPYLLDGDVVVVPFPEIVAVISGAVRRPGTYELVKGKDLGELLQLAGGFTSAVARKLPIRLVRRNDLQQETFQNLPFATTGEPANLALHDDDHLVVPSSSEVQRTVLVIGAVVGADALDTATTSKRLPFVEGDTVRSLIERAGGIRAQGDLQRSYISRVHDGDSVELIPIDLDALLVRRDFTADKPVVMGDTIVVPPMQYSVMVEGAVGRSGLYTYNPRFGIPEYIAVAGGRSRTAQDLDEVKLIDPRGVTHDYKLGMKPSPGDAILVPERNFTRSELVQIVIAGAGLILSGVAITIAATR